MDHCAICDVCDGSILYEVVGSFVKCVHCDILEPIVTYYNALHLPGKECGTFKFWHTMCYCKILVEYIN